MQGLMGNYLEQSKDLFVKMQEQMQIFPFAAQPNKTEKE
jgi:polyhydroxyalkanoate synthesis regulator protein